MDFDFDKLDIGKPIREERQKEMALEWWSNNNGISFCDWPEELLKYSYPLKLVHLPKDLIEKLIMGTMTDEREIQVIQEYEKLLEPALKEMGYPDKFFVKLISRSPKDYLANSDNHGKPEPVTSVAEIVRSFLCSERCFEDLCFLRFIYQSAIVLRPYIDFHPSNEWRVIILAGKIMGISQYYYLSVFPELSHDTIPHIKESIMKFVNDHVIPHITVDSYIADIVVKNNGEDPVLLETNPFGLSDPCLFKDYYSFDETIMWLSADDTPEKMKL